MLRPPIEFGQYLSIRYSQRLADNGVVASVHAAMTDGVVIALTIGGSIAAGSVTLFGIHLQDRRQRNRENADNVVAAVSEFIAGVEHYGLAMRIADDLPVSERVEMLLGPATQLMKAGALLHVIDEQLGTLAADIRLALTDMVELAPGSPDRARQSGRLKDLQRQLRVAAIATRTG